MNESFVVSGTQPYWSAKSQWRYWLSGWRSKALPLVLTRRSKLLASSYSCTCHILATGVALTAWSNHDGNNPLINLFTNYKQGNERLTTRKTDRTTIRKWATDYKNWTDRLSWIVSTIQLLGIMRQVRSPLLSTAIGLWKHRIPSDLRS